ncbi:zinc-dependent metalloprotease family protein [Litoreibacter janthinus]|uniref:Metallo-peptidase family M12B Reprolysin-like n=1 Tax=Litoreibacter janthinus TaxID=670154 RepID=A0A1I6IEL8_9RHOB|nr:zinc-dependent metalloprotease family protein [Litoreibacter janthinus]SFR65215.1 Metallo-peptidase family M12B Reprolysin-like [Litoreibacter janthinus]
MTKPPIPTVKPVAPQPLAPVAPTAPVTPVAPQPIAPIAPAPATPVAPQKLAPVSPPAATPAVGAPSGSTGATVPCCPDVAFFEKSSGGRTSYFAYDDKTTLAATPGTDEYWIPPTKTKTLPSDKETRDGARWVSVGVGLETQLEIKFDGAFQNACLLNCTYEFAPAGIADVTSPAITASGMAFKIKGKTAGEGSLKVMCDGKLRGYFHIWCIQPATINVDVASLVTPHSAAASYVVADLQSYINEVYRQVCITVQLNDAGAVTVAPTLTTYLNTATAAGLAHLNEMDTLAQAASAKLTNNYRLYYYVNTAGHSGALGVVSGGLGSSGPGFSFFDSDLPGSYNTMAHEFGHLLNLSHPAHDFDGDEYPPWQASNQANNILADDNWNLMGYQGPVSSRGANRKPLRYRQWKKCNRS